MRAVVWLLSEILKAVLRMEHKLDILVRDRKPPKGGFLLTPQIQNQNMDPITGLPVRYVPVQLPDHNLEVMVRESTDTPVSAEPPRTVGG